MDVSIIIPNYNGQELLKKNFQSVLSAVDFYQGKTGARCEIILIDDASTDESVTFIKFVLLRQSLSGRTINLIVNKENMGFSPTINKAVKHAKNDILVLLNSDVSPEEDFLLPLLAHFKNSNVFAVGSMDKSKENDKIILRGRGIGRWKKGFLIHSRGEVDKTNTLWVNGGSGAFRKAFWGKLGGFCELYAPYYWEDIDLSYRAQKSGYTVLFEPKSVVVHEHEKGAIFRTQKPKKIKAIAYRNQILFTWINATDVDILLQHVLWLPYYIIAAIVKGDLVFLAGLAQAFIRLPNVIQFRANILKHFSKSDREIISSIS